MGGHMDIQERLVTRLAQLQALYADKKAELQAVYGAMRQVATLLEEIQADAAATKEVEAA